MYIKVAYRAAWKRKRFMITPCIQTLATTLSTHRSRSQRSGWWSSCAQRMLSKPAARINDRYQHQQKHRLQSTSGCTIGTIGATWCGRGLSTGYLSTVYTYTQHIIHVSRLNPCVGALELTVGRLYILLAAAAPATNLLNVYERLKAKLLHQLPWLQSQAHRS